MTFLTKAEPAAATNSDGLFCLLDNCTGVELDNDFLYPRLSKVKPV
jgi:hypothetical protein